MIALPDMLQGISRANAWAVSALAPTYLTRPVLIDGTTLVVADLLEPETSERRIQ